MKVLKGPKALLPRGAKERTLPFGIGRGLRMSIDFHGGQTKLFLGLYETELNPSLRQLCRRGSRCFDIGGNIGYDALVLAKLTGAEVLSVECDLALSRQINHNAALNSSIGTRIKVWQGMVGDGRSSGSEITIDELANRFFMPEIVKVDIEGAEVAALHGAQSVLSSKPSWVIEVHSRALEEECIDLLRERGYVPEIVDQRRWFPDYRPTEHNRWLVAESPRCRNG